MTWIAAIAAIPLCAFLYRLRGAGWEWGPPESKTVGLFLLSMVMASPLIAIGSPWAALSLVAVWTGRAGHGTVYHDGYAVPPRPRQSNPWLSWMPGQVGQEPNTWKDRTGLGWTGFLLTAPTAIACMPSGHWAYALALVCAGAIGKPVAYALGWRVLPYRWQPTRMGEWIFGAFIGAAVAIGLVV